jgi:5'-3' exonuclease
VSARAPRRRARAASFAAARGAADPPILLIDALPFVFRAYYSLPVSIVDPRGRPVNAVRGFANVLLAHLRDRAPRHVAVAFDESLTSSFRNELYAPYKAQRASPPAELKAQIDRCRAFAAALGLTTLSDARHEADDLIATLAHRHGRRGRRVVIATNDKDLMQLVDEHVSILDVARDTVHDERSVRLTLGVPPRLVPDLLGLAGDAVDNIPGVPGVGRRTAVALLGHFDGLDALYAGLERVADLPLRGAAGLARRLAEHRQLAFLSRELATVVRDAPAPTRLDALRVRRPDRAALEPLLTGLGFTRLLERLLPASVS